MSNMQLSLQKLASVLSSALLVSLCEGMDPNSQNSDPNRSLVTAMQKHNHFVHGEKGLSNNPKSTILDEICDICCEAMVTARYPERTEIAWRMLRTKDEAIHYPDCHGSRICNPCIAQCRKCPFCRREREASWTIENDIKYQIWIQVCLVTLAISNVLLWHYFMPSQLLIYDFVLLR